MVGCFICQVYKTAVKFPERFSRQGPTAACHEVNEAHEENVPKGCSKAISSLPSSDISVCCW